MDILVGYTGFVGSNIFLQHEFDKGFNSSNIEQSYGLNPDLCVYAGIRAEKFLANKDPQGDFANIESAINNIKNINPKRLVLISTIDVFKCSTGADEDTEVEIDALQAYGSNRFFLERWCAENIGACHILRLPGLFGKNIKKNFIYDVIHLVPSMLNAAKYSELVVREPRIEQYYELKDNGFYKCICTTALQEQELMRLFQKLDFSALNFTDSRGVFQFYNLDYLWKHIQYAICENIPLLHLAVEPVSVNEVFRAVKGTDFVNEIAKEIPNYDFKTKYAEGLGGNQGYIFNKQKVLEDIVRFVEDEEK